MSYRELIISEIKRRLNEWRFLSSTEAKYRYEAYTELLEWINSMPEEPIEKSDWELVHEFVEKFGRIPKDEDELNNLVQYVLKR